jgi:hypothetical protein
MRKSWGRFLGFRAWAVGEALLALFAFTSISRAALYVITFTDPGANNVGSGQIDVEGGLAASAATSM